MINSAQFVAIATFFSALFRYIYNYLIYSFIQIHLAIFHFVRADLFSAAPELDWIPVPVSTANLAQRRVRGTVQK